MSRIRDFFTIGPRVRLGPGLHPYISKPGPRAGCMVRFVVIALLLLAARALAAQVDAVLQIHGRDAEMRVGNPTAHPLAVTVTLFADSTLADTVPARISPSAFTLKAGASQTVRLRLH